MDVLEDQHILVFVHNLRGHFLLHNSTKARTSRSRGTKQHALASPPTQRANTRRLPVENSARECVLAAGI